MTEPPVKSATTMTVTLFWLDRNWRGSETARWIPCPSFTVPSVDEGSDSQPNPSPARVQSVLGVSSPIACHAPLVDQTNVRDDSTTLEWFTSSSVVETPSVRLLVEIGNAMNPTP